KGDPEIFAEMMVSIKHHQTNDTRASIDVPVVNRFPARPTHVRVENAVPVAAPSKTPTAPKWPMVPEFVPLPKSPPSAAFFPTFRLEHHLHSSLSSVSLAGVGGKDDGVDRE